MEKLVSGECLCQEGGRSVVLQSRQSPRPSLQVKLSGSHLTPLCYSFISYVQVSDSGSAPREAFKYGRPSHAPRALLGHLSWV